MLLESRIDDRFTLLIDCESQGGVDKNAAGASGHPDRVLESAVKVIRAAAERLGEGLSSAGKPPPVTMEVEFGVTINQNAVVALARSPTDAHIRVKLRWDG
ncbi:MAG: hypothetical protein FJ102_18655 [Deltaproteobacteria bacterium]|nr:hypothetical protein [Deltaproteobacteria bacterium]